MIISSEEFAKPQHVTKICGLLDRSMRYINFAYIFKIFFYFFLNKYEKNMKEHLIITQDLSYKQIVTTKAYVMKG